MTKLANDNESTDEVVGEDWDAAFDEFYEKEIEDENDDDKSDDDAGSDADSDKSGDDDSGDKDDESKDDDASDASGSDDDKPAKDDDAKDDKEADDSTEEKPDQKSLVKDALKEVYSEQAQADADLRATINEALAVVRPEGIPDPRVDSDGDPIKSPADVEKLYNPATGEKYTPSEAKAWYDQATAKYEESVQEAQQEATQVARTAKRMEAGREAVLRNYGDFINENPDVAKKVLMAYMATLKVRGGDDVKSQYVYDAPLDMLEFYNDHMYPYVELAEKKKEADEAAAAAEAKKQEDLKKAKAQRDESRDWPTNVSDDATKTGDDMDWDDAFKEYYKGK